MKVQVRCTDVVRKLDGREKLILIDVRERKIYDQSHLPSAINIPSEELSQLAPQYVPDRGKQIFLYGAEGSAEPVMRAAELLGQLGYGRIHVCEGGFEHWKEQGFTAHPSHHGIRLNFL